MVKSSFLQRRQLVAATLSFAVAVFIVAVPQRAVVAQSATATTTAAQKSLSAKERAEVFERVWKTVDEKYYDPKFNGVDWEAVREKYRPLAEKAASDAEFYDVLTLMVGELRDTRARSLSASPD